LAKKKKINWRDIGLIAALGFAWSKLGLGTAVKDVVKDVIPEAKPSDPCPPGMKRRLVGGRWICILRFD